MSRHAKRGPQALAADRRQARPMALRGASPPGGTVGRAAGRVAERAPRGRAEPAVREASRGRPVLAESEPEVDLALHAVAGASARLLGRAGALAAAELRGGILLEWSDERRAAAERARLRRRELAPRLRSTLNLDSDEDAEALLDLDAEWLRYARPEETADVAALLPAGLHGLRGRAPLLKTPRWKRLRLAPPPS